MSTGYGLRLSREINGRKRFSTNTYNNIALLLQKSPKISGNLRQFAGEYHLGVLYSSSPLGIRRGAHRGGGGVGGLLGGEDRA